MKPYNVKTWTFASGLSSCYLRRARPKFIRVSDLRERRISRKKRPAYCGHGGFDPTAPDYTWEHGADAQAQAFQDWSPR